MRQKLPLDIASLLSLIFLIVLPFLYYTDLPDTIPIHYGADGKADGYGSKLTIFLLPAIGTLLFAGLTMLNKYPHLFNYPHEITEENKERSYRSAQSMISALKLLVTLIFTYITFVTIRKSGSDTASLGTLFLPLTFFMIFGLIAYYVARMLRS